MPLNIPDAGSDAEDLLIEQAIDAAFHRLTELMGVETGDVPAIYCNGETAAEIRAWFRKYIALERMYANILTNAGA